MAIRVAPPMAIDLDSYRARMAVPTPYGWKEELVCPMPRVYWNHVAKCAVHESRALRDLNQDTRVLLFNETNRWDRDMLLEMLATAPGVQDWLPAIEPLTERTLNDLAPGELYLALPARRRARISGLLLTRLENREVQYTRIYKGARGIFRREDLPAARKLMSSRKLRWLSRLSGMPVGPAGPVEWRFYLHRDETGAFALAGEVAKYDILRPRMGTMHCYRLIDALTNTFGRSGAELATRMRAGALTIARTISLFLPGIVHFAVDFWVDAAGHIMLADLTGRYRTHWLQRAGESEALRRIQDHPVRFARVILSRGVDKLYVDFGGGEREPGMRSAASSGLASGA